MANTYTQVHIHAIFSVQNRECIIKQSWQEGYGAFSYNKSSVDCVIDYIKNQEVHHRKKTFTEEYHEFLEKFEVDFDERYLFVPVEYR